MKTSTIVFLLIIGGFIVLLIVFGWWTYHLPQPKPGRDCHKTSDWKWSENCMYIQELTPDSTLESPSELSVYLVDFSYSPSLGKPFFLPVWYRFRYVNVMTGGYSDYSQWTTTPVISGSCTLPCAGGTCPSKGYSTCTYNRPVIGISTLDSQYNPTKYQSGTYVYLNLHRYVGTSSSQTSPPDNAKDEIIGTLQPGQYVGGVQYFTFSDVFDNPCSEGCPTPSWCAAPSTC